MRQKKFWIIILLALVLNTPFAFSEDMLDRKTFSGEIGEVGKDKGQPDNFVFQNGQFESTLCSGFGYGKGDYKATAVSGVIDFTAQTTSKDGGIMSWKGTVKQSAVEGTVTTVEKVKEGDQEVNKSSESWFKGVLK